MGISLSGGPYGYNRFDDMEKNLRTEGSKVAAPGADDDNGDNAAKKHGFTNDEKAFDKALLKAVGKPDGDANKELAKVRLQGKKEKLEKQFKAKSATKSEEVQMTNQMQRYAHAISMLEAKSPVSKVKGVEGKAMAQGYDKNKEGTENFTRGAKAAKETGAVPRMTAGHKKNIDPATGKAYEAPGADESADGKRKAAVKMMKKAAGNSPGRGDAGRGSTERVMKTADNIKKSGMFEEYDINKEDVIDWLVAEDYASNDVSAEVMWEHCSDEFLCAIESDIQNFLNENLLQEREWNVEHGYHAHGAKKDPAKYDQHNAKIDAKNVGDARRQAKARGLHINKIK